MGEKEDREKERQQQENNFYSGCTRYDPDRIINYHRDILTDKDIELMKAFVDYKISTKHISEVRARKIFYSLVSWKTYLNTPFSKLKIDDIYRGISAMKNGEVIGGNCKGRPLSQNTKVDLVKILKMFLRYLIKHQGLKIPLELIYDREDGIAIPPSQKTQITHEQILTVQELISIFKCARNRREQAIFAVLYESGCRIGELGRMRWGDIKIDEYGVKIYIRDRKNRQKRYNRLTVYGKPVLMSLLDNMIVKPDPEDFIFVDDEGKMVKYGYCVAILQKAAAKAGIKKHVTCHLLRHCRATHMKAQGFSDSEIKMAIWNNEKTDQWERYVNLSETDRDGEYLRIAGIKPEEQKTINQEIGRPRTCFRCGEISMPNAEHCWKCGYPLIEEKLKKYHSIEDDIDEFVRRTIDEKLAELRKT